MSTGMLEAALGYAGRGWHVFVLSSTKIPLANCEPCKVHETPVSKESCECLTCHGFYAATLDAERIRAMLERHPRGCLAIRTGTVSGIAVVDFDFKVWATAGEPACDDPAWRTMCGLDARRLLPGTVMAETGSLGLHLLYGHPGGYLMSGAAKYGPGVDSKADGGYVVAAPSVTASGKSYRWLPGAEDWRHDLTQLPDELAQVVRPAPGPPRVVTVQPWARPGVAGNRLSGLVRKVLEAPAGERNDLLHWASKKAGAMVAAGEASEQVVVDVLIEAGLSVGLTASEIGDGGRGTIASGLRKGRVTV